MIELYSGTPGSGKSLHAASDIKIKCKFNRPVIINFPVNLNIPYIKKAYDEGNLVILDNSEITPSKLYELSEYFLSKFSIKEDGIHLFIDECQLLFNSREWNGNNDRMQWIKFFSQHRHFKYHIVLIAQFDRMLDRQIRCLIEYECRHMKLKNYGWRGAVLCLFLGYNAVMVCRDWYGQNLRCGTEIMHISKRHFKIYDTTYVFDTVGQG